MLNRTYANQFDTPPNMTEQQKVMWDLSKTFFEACWYVQRSIKDTIKCTITQEEYEGKIKGWDK